MCIVTAFFFLQIFIAFGELFLSVNWAVVTDILLVSACKTISIYFGVFSFYQHNIVHNPASWWATGPPASRKK